MDNWKLTPCCFFVYLFTTPFYIFSLLKLHNNSALKPETQTFKWKKHSIINEEKDIYSDKDTSVFCFKFIQFYTIFVWVQI